MSIFEKQQTRLNSLVAGMTPAQKKYYSGRINRVSRNIKLEKYISSMPPSAGTKKKYNVKRKEELGENLLDIEKIADIAQKAKSGDLGGLLPKTHHNAHVFGAIFRGIKPNITTISKSTSEKAILTRAGTVYARDGKAQTEGFLDQMGMKGYEILPESTSEGLVLRNTATGKIKIAFRGTLLPKDLAEVSTSVGDIGTDAAIVAGYEDQTPQFKAADEQVAGVQEKYGADFDEIYGYSLGGAKAHVFGDKYGINTTQFNPLVGRTQVSSGETSAKHKIIRTTEDIPSLGAGFINRENTEVTSIYPLKSSSLNIKRHHDLENFIKRGRPRHSDSHIENLAKQVVIDGGKAADIVLMSDMANHIDTIEETRPPLPRFGKIMTQAQKEKFDAFKEPSFTDYIHKYNNGGNGVDTDADGKLLPSARLSDKTSHGKMWAAAGGEFTPEEQAIFDNAGIGETNPSISKETMRKIANGDADTRQALLDEHVTQMTKSQNALTDATNAEEIHPMRNNGNNGIGGGASTILGIVAGAVADPLVGLGEKVTGYKISDDMDQRTAMVGALGGVLGASAIARAGGSVASNPELGVALGIGALSNIVGKEVGNYATRKGANRFVSGEVSGASAGATAATLGTAAAAGGLLGAEAMIPLDAETLGLASVAGATIGAGIGAVGYGLGKLGINI